MSESQPIELNCPQCLEMLDAFHDLELSSSEAEQVERHLEACDGCRRQLSQIEIMVESIKALPALELKQDFSDLIESRILAERASAAANSGRVKEESALAEANNVVPLAGRRQSSPWLYLAASAAAVAIICLVFNRPVANLSQSRPAKPELVAQQRSENISSTEAPGQSSATATAIPDRQAQAAVRVPQSASAPSLSGRATVPVERELLANVGNESGAKADLNGNQISDGEEMVALFGESEASETGMSTNEDGLYAIKL